MIEIEEKKKLYIPMGIKEKNEFWEGFGGKEAKNAILIILIALAIDVIYYLLFRNILTFMIFIMTAIGSSIMVTTKGMTNLSVIDQINNMRKFMLSQKFYKYKKLEEWR